MPKVAGCAIYIYIDEIRGKIFWAAKGSGKNLMDTKNTRSVLKTARWGGPLVLALILAAWAPGIAFEPSKVKYGQQPEVELLEEEQAAMETLSETLNKKTMITRDNNLVLVARKLAYTIQQEPSRQEEVISSEYIFKYRTAYGIYDSSIKCQFVFFYTGDDIRSQIRFRFSDYSRELNHMGVGAVLPDKQGRSGVAVILFTDRRAILNPFPCRVNLPSSYILRGRLANSASGLKPQVLMTPPRGEVQKISTNAKGDAFAANIPFNQGEGTYRIEVMARGGGKSLVAALMEVEAGQVYNMPTATFEVSGFDSAPMTEEEAEKMMLDMINQVREKEGLIELRDDYHLSKMAKAHSRDMKKHGYVGHLSPEFGDFPQRKFKAGLQDFTVRENVALDVSLAGAMNNLLKSPGHRAPILDPEATNVGVGVVFDDSAGTRHYYVTQEFGDLY